MGKGKAKRSKIAAEKGKAKGSKIAAEKGKAKGSKIAAEKGKAKGSKIAAEKGKEKSEGDYKCSVCDHMSLDFHLWEAHGLKCRMKQKAEWKQIELEKEEIKRKEEETKHLAEKKAKKTSKSDNK